MLEKYGNKSKCEINEIEKKYNIEDQQSLS